MRIAVLLLAILVPFQLAWAGAQGMLGHAGSGPVAGYHVHDHDHGPDGHSHSGDEAGDEVGPGPASGDEEHAGHFHPVFPVVIAAPASQPTRAIAGAKALAPLEGFASHMPPPLDRPPTARA